MAKVPVFFEISEGKHQIKVVERIRAALFQRGLKVLPYAASVQEFQALTKVLPASGHQPGLFVINTFGSEDQLSSLDESMGETAALFFRRELMWLKAAAGSVHDLGITTRIGKMHPRPSGIWYYGKLNYEQIAQRAAYRIEQYIKSNDFRCFEESLRFSNSGRMVPDSHERRMEQGSQA